MNWSKIGKFLVDNQDDIKKIAENTAKAARCANNLHEQHKKRKAAEEDFGKELYKIVESVQPKKVSISHYNRDGERLD